MTTLLSNRNRIAWEAPGEPRSAKSSPAPRRSIVILVTATRVVLSIALAAGVIFAALSYQRHLVATKIATPHKSPPERIRTVEILAAKIEDVQPALRLYGQIAAGRTVDLRMLVGGEITSVPSSFVDGGKVENGAALVTIDRFDYEGALIRARAELKEAEARIVETRARIALELDSRARASEQSDIAEREVERLTTLQGRGATSDATLDTSRSRLAGARAAVESRDNQMRILEAQLTREQASLDRLRWNVTKAERDIRNTTLFAPFEGIVSNVAAEAGRLVNVNDRVATLVDLDRIEVKFTLNDSQYGRLVGEGNGLEGRRVAVRWQGGNRQLDADGAIDRIAPVVSAATGGFEVFARLQRSPTTDALRPGAFVTVITADSTYSGVVRLPQSAVHPGNRIFAVNEDSRLTPIEVDVVGFDGEQLLVRGNIKDGTRIMASRLPDAGPGVLIKPR